MEEKNVFKDLRWRKENADLGTLTTRLGRDIQEAHSNLGSLDLSAFGMLLEVYSEKHLFDIQPGEITVIEETASNVESVVNEFVKLERKIGEGYLPEAAVHVREAKDCIETYSVLLETVLVESYELFMQDSVVFEDSLKSKNLFDIEKSRAVLEKTLVLYKEIEHFAKKRGFFKKKRLDKKINKYIAEFDKVADIASEILDAEQRLCSAEWGKNNISLLEKLYRKFYNGWFRQGIISKCEKARYPEGKSVAEALCGDIAYVLDNLADVKQTRKDLCKEVDMLDSYAQEVADATASPAGIQRIKRIVSLADPIKYSDLRDTFYFAGMVNTYVQKCAGIRELAREKAREISRACIKDYALIEAAFKRGDAVEDMELEHLQRTFDELNNHELSGRITLLRRRMNQNSGFFSMTHYLKQNSCPPGYLILWDTLLGRNGTQDWIERIAIFSKTLEGMECSSDEEKAWLKHARYAIKEDSARGYLRTKLAGSRQMKCAVDLALVAIDDKADASQLLPPTRCKNNPKLYK